MYIPQPKLFIFLIFLVAFSVNTICQPVTDVHSAIIDDIDNGRISDAVAKLENLKNNTPKKYIANNYDYLHARLEEKQGNYGKAAAIYQTVVRRNSILSVYALWHLSRIMRDSGNKLMERIYLRELTLISEGGLHDKAVAGRIARSYLESGNFAEAIDQFSIQVVPGTSGSETDSGKMLKLNRSEMVLIANAYLGLGQTEKAREFFVELIEQAPNPNQPDDFTLEAARGLDHLQRAEGESGESAPHLSPEEHFKRASIYQFNRDFAGARLHFEAIVKNHPESSRVPVSLFQIGRGFAQEREYQKAVVWFEKLQSQFPGDKLAASALYNSASAFANLEQTREAVSRYEKYIVENPEASNIERAYLNIIDSFRDEGDNKSALVWAKNTQERFRGEMGESVALFSEARIYISNEDWLNARRSLDRLSSMNNLGGTRIAGGTNKREVYFLQGLMRERLADIGGAIEQFLKIPDSGRDYYGLRATDRINALSNTKQGAPIVEKAKSRLLGVVNQTLTNSNAAEIRNAAQNALRFVKDPDGREKLFARVNRANELIEGFQSGPELGTVRFRRKELRQADGVLSSGERHQAMADELLFLGLFDEGAPELETALRRGVSNDSGSLSDFSADTAFTLAILYKRGDFASRAIGYLEPLWKGVPKDYPLELIPKRHQEILFPTPYKDALLRYGKEKNVDPRFVLSIMRQESRFRADVKSVAAARGLMQFISSTSNKMAKEMKIENFVQDDLYNPPTAIRFGSHYLENIFRDFPNQPAAVAASYNGGEDRMMRWHKRSKTEDPDQYVPEIIFSQTKDYAYKVMSNYHVYRLLYDERLTKKPGA